jgi:hypothetical protein
MPRAESGVLKDILLHLDILSNCLCLGCVSSCHTQVFWTRCLNDMHILLTDSFLSLIIRWGYDYPWAIRALGTLKAQPLDGAFPLLPQLFTMHTPLAGRWQWCAELWLPKAHQWFFSWSWSVSAPPGSFDPPLNTHPSSQGAAWGAAGRPRSTWGFIMSWRRRQMASRPRRNGPRTFLGIL